MQNQALPRTVLSCLFLVSITFLVFANSLGGPFISDDVATIQRSTLVLKPLHFWAQPSSMLTSCVYLAWGSDPVVYHLVNVGLHTVCVILVFFLLRLFFGIGASFLGACLFAVHPIHAEAVSWISGGGHVMVGIISLACFFLYGKACGYTTAKGALAVRWYLFCLLIFTYSMVDQYPRFLIFPVLVALFDVTFNQWRRRWKLWIPFFCIGAFRLFFARAEIVQRIQSLEQGPQGALVWHNPLTQTAHSLFSNFFLLVWPHKLSLYHDAPQPGVALAALELVLLGLIAAALPWVGRRSQALIVGIIFFVVYLIPTFSPLKVTGMMAERYLYLAPVLISTIIAWCYERSRAAGRHVSVVATIAIICILGLYAARTVLRNREWVNPRQLWSTALQVAPNNSYVHTQMGRLYHSEGQFNEAIQEYEKAIELSADNAIAYNNLGVTYNSLGKGEEAIAAYRRSIAIDPGFAEAYFNLGNVYRRLKDPRNAILMYQHAVALHPRLFEAYFNLGNVYLSIGDDDRAAAFFTKAAVLRPKFLPAYRQLVELAIRKDRMQDVVSLYERALSENLDYFEAYYTIGTKHSQAGRARTAIPLFRRAVRIDPGSGPAYAALGWAYCAVGNTSEALRASARALELDPSLGVAHNTMAVAYYYAKQYALALKHCDEAIERGFEVTGEFLELLKPYRN